MPGSGEGVLAAVAREAARRFGDAPALVAADGWPVPYRLLHRRSDEVAAGLARRGVRPGDVVALVLPSTPEYVVAYLALAKLGAATAGVNPSLAPPERAALVALAEPRLVLATGDLAAGLPAELEVVQVTTADHAAGVLDDLRAPGEAPAPLPHDPDRPVAVVFTSGTTGTPRGAVFTDRQLAAIGRIDAGDTWGGGGPMIGSTQFAHVGFMTKLSWYLRLGTTTHLLHRWRAADVLALVARHRMPSVGGVAPQIALLLRVPDFDRHDLSAVRTLVVGGGPSPPALVEEARRRFDAGYSIRYSSTESGGVGTGTAFDAADDEALHTVGRPRPGVEVRVHDGDRVLPPGETGEVCLRSAAVMAGYWRDPAATAAVLRDGWLRTGDLGTLDDAGRLRLVGRSKELYIRGGYNVFPMEVEAVLASHPDVADVAVVPRPDPVMGEVGVAVVVPRHPGRPPTLDDLRAFAGSRLAVWKLPEGVRAVDELPLTAMQKVDRRALAAAERAPAPGPAAPA